MAALSADRNTEKLVADQTESYPVAASTKVYAGALVALNTSGYAIAAASTAGLKVVGVSTEQVDNSTGADGDLNIEVQTGVFEFTTSGGSVDDVGKPVWVTDDNNVTLTPGNVLAGIVHRYVSATSVYVHVEPAAREVLGATIRDLNRNELLKFTATADAVNEITLVNAATGSGPSLSATGGDTNIPVTVAGKGTGQVLLGQATSGGVKLVASQPLLDANANELVKFVATADAVNEITITNAATGNPATITGTGGDATVGITIDPKGAGALQLGSADSTLGLFGTTAAVQQNHIANSAGDDATAVNAILVVLETYGLVKSS
jgi:hypothetical protein